jgi:hypothetical protein
VHAVKGTGASGAEAQRGCVAREGVEVDALSAGDLLDTQSIASLQREGRAGARLDDDVEIGTSGTAARRSRSRATSAPTVGRRRAQLLLHRVRDELIERQLTVTRGEHQLDRRQLVLAERQGNPHRDAESKSGLGARLG